MFFCLVLVALPPRIRTGLYLWMFFPLFATDQMKYYYRVKNEIISAVVLSQRAGANYSRYIDERWNNLQEEKSLHYPGHANGGTLVAVAGREYNCICAPYADRIQHPERRWRSDAVYAH